ASIVSVAVHLRASTLDLSHAKLVPLDPKSKSAAKGVAMLRDEIEKRTRLTLEVVPALVEPTEPAILLGTAEDLAVRGYQPRQDCAVPVKPDGYSIWIDCSHRSAL